ncbi:hypothetical protein P168DRAFT_292932 [Aspergillus campestris IBT 28561]|uniref:Ubiquitin conjugating enzyme n=1 Tax=Aspergillus campestris (strain IBT 28561) TaxID=1392248 RepID=A0A2I1CTT8_ASPC2|nr:uncharacterized protein P168DRAFT_292932 [Aspergillus campestris IBT 28561]PKY01027.1 hypothetical protein P168DRAFT_292932 [Aspergillus campestris IBT 28561]
MVLGSVLLRRGSDFVAEMKDKDQQPDIKIAGWLAALVVLSVIMFFVFAGAIEYTYGWVVPTLAAVEQTDPDLYVRIDTDPNANKSADPNAPEPEDIVRPAPVTRSLRSTLRHLRSRGGFRSRFRGFSMALLCMAAPGFITAFFPFAVARSFLGQFAINMVVAVLTANLQMAWVHIVISEPSSKRFYQRIPSFKDWNRIAPVAVFEYAVTLGAFYLPMMVTCGFSGLDDPANFDIRTSGAYARAFASFSGPALLSFLVSIPARAIFIRVAASMLPEDHEAIVPFDRSFGGKVVPAILGGSGKLGIADAWRTFDRAARIRYVKAIAKGFAIMFAFAFVYVAALCAVLVGGGVKFGDKA